MAECIVCLGGLRELDKPSLTNTEKPHDHVSHRGLDSKDTSPAIDSQDLDADCAQDIHVPVDDKHELIAQIKPCNHQLHDQCLKPWVERANSCPFCRATFNEVHVRKYINGPIVNTYAVGDKIQQPDLDPIEVTIADHDLFDDNPGACLICESDDHEDQLLLCDGCDASTHTFCAGLDAVPVGTWFCQHCLEDGTHLSATVSGASSSSSSVSNSIRGRSRTVAGRRRDFRDGRDTEWTRVWQQVWDRLNFDLDFPFDEDDEAAAEVDAQQRDFRLWQQRFAVAERTGGANRLRDVASAIFSHRAIPTDAVLSAEGESQEELRAWNAFDHAAIIQTDESREEPRGRKRKSPTASPRETTPAEPERKLKRPLRRSVHPNNGESSSEAPRDAGKDAVDPAATTIGPSFLSSLLREVESSASAPGLNGQSNPAAVHCHPNGQPCSPRSRSPASSPAGSSYNTPRARSISPNGIRLSRPQSPPPLTSLITPIYAQQRPGAIFSPADPETLPLTSSPCRPAAHHFEEITLKQADDNHSEIAQPKTNESGTNRNKKRRLSINEDHASKRRKSVVAEEAISPRSRIAFAAKEEIQALVKKALRPHWHSGVLNEEQYTDINKHVSHQLYDIVEGTGGELDALGRDQLQDIAAKSVSHAITALNLTTDKDKLESA